MLLLYKILDMQISVHHMNNILSGLWAKNCDLKPQTLPDYAREPEVIVYSQMEPRSTCIYKPQNK